MHAQTVELFVGTYLLKTPPRSEAFKHSGGDNLLCTSPTVTLYLEVDDSKDSLPGTLQKTSDGDETPESITSFPDSERGFMSAK